ncbi:hypothetical protein YC2023_012085 [Brassica napus]
MEVNKAKLKTLWHNTNDELYQVLKWILKHVVVSNVSNDEIMRKVPRGPNPITSPPTPVFPMANVGFKREIPRKGPSNVKSPSFSLFSIADIGVNRKVPNGPNHDTSPPSSQILVTDIGVNREIPRNDPNKITSRSIPTVSIADNNF